MQLHNYALIAQGSPEDKMETKLKTYLLGKCCVTSW